MIGTFLGRRTSFLRLARPDGNPPGLPDLVSGRRAARGLPDWLAIEADQGCHRNHVPVVVLDDRDERALIARAQEVQIARSHFEAVDVAVAVEAEHARLDCLERAAADPRSVQPSGNVQEIQMRPSRRRADPVHHVARCEHRQVEGLAVERDEQRRALDALDDPAEHRCFFRGRPQEKLLDDETT